MKKGQLILRTCTPRLPLAPKVGITNGSSPALLLHEALTGTQTPSPGCHHTASEPASLLEYRGHHPTNHQKVSLL